MLSTLALVSGLVAVTVPAASASGAGANAPSATSGKGKPSAGSRLSDRLLRLSDPSVQAMSAAAQAQAMAVSASGPGSIERTAGGEIVAEVRVADTSPATIASLRSAGASIVHVSSSLPIVTVAVAPESLRVLAAVPQVRYVAEVLEPMRNSCPTGIVSEGVAQMRVDTARTSFPSITGAGVKVGVLSDSYDKLGGAATDVTNGELPGVTNTCGHTTAVSPVTENAFTGNSDEGRAMAQIVHDVAPGATLAFATARGGEQIFADNIRALATAGAKVIVDDYTYFAEPMFQDGVIGKAVEDVSSAGVAYFSSAANSNLFLGPNAVASYEAPSFRPTTCPTSITSRAGYASATCHDFDPGPGVDTRHALTFNGSLSLSLGWNEPQFGVTTDLDFFVLDHSTGAYIASSEADNAASTKAFESIGGSATGTFDFVVVRYSGTATPRVKWISNRSVITVNEYPVSNGGDVVGPTTFGHNVSRSGASVAAVPYNNPNTPETFSSRGPALYCWGPVDGTTPAAALPGGCQSATIDMAATDGTLNSFFGTGNRFYGTSAAAPHAAGVAALIQQKRPCLASDQVIYLMKKTGQAVGSYGVDAVGGGLVDADAALAAAGTGSCAAPAKPVLAIPLAPASGWFKTAVVGSVSSSDADGIDSFVCTGATVGPVGAGPGGTFVSSVTVSGDGVRSVSCTAVDGVGAKSAASDSSPTIRIDTAPPNVTWTPAGDTCSARDGAVCRGVQTSAFAAADGGSGLADPSKASFSVATTTQGSAVFVPSGAVADVAGNLAPGLNAGPYQIGPPVAPTAALTAPTATVSLTSSVVVRWAAAPPSTVPPTTITSYQLQRAVKAPGGALGAYANYGGPRTTTSVTVAMTAGYGYCLRVIATASNGLTSPPSAPRCTTRATDDRALVASRVGWVRGVSKTAYLRTVSASSRVGAVLVVPKSRGRSLALVVTKLPGGGTIGVYVKGKKVASVSTNARRLTPKAIVTLRVATAGKPVVLRVDSRGTRGVIIDGFAQLP